MRVKVKVDNGWCWVYNGSMKIEFGLMSILSTALLAILMLIPTGSISINTIDLSVRINSDSVSLGFHPTFICHADTDGLPLGACFGNVVIVNANVPDTHMPRLIDHESRHLEHWKALGEFTWVARYILTLEPSYVDWRNSSIELAEMWKPPHGWPDRWCWLRVKYCLI